MSLGLLLTVLGILATLAFGAWAVYLSLRRRYPGELSVFTEQCIPLFDAIVKSVPELSVHYRGAPVGEGLVLLKGFLANTSRKDINPPMVAENVAFCLQSPFRWLAGQVVSSSEHVAAKIHVSNDKLEFEMGLFRCGEHVRFDALAEVPIQTAVGGNSESNVARRLQGAIVITHRIADTSRIAIRQLPPGNDPSTSDVLGSVLILTLMSAGLFLALVPSIRAHWGASAPSWWVLFPGGLCFVLLVGLISHRILVRRSSRIRRRIGIR